MGGFGSAGEKIRGEMLCGGRSRQKFGAWGKLTIVSKQPPHERKDLSKDAISPLPPVARTAHSLQTLGQACARPARNRRSSSDLNGQTNHEISAIVHILL